MRSDLLPYLRFDTRDMCLADVLKTIDQIRSTHPLVVVTELRGKILHIPSVVDGHVVADAIVEHTETGIGVLRLTFDAHVEIEGFLGLQVGIALKPPAHLCLADADGGTAVHLPVVPEFAHAGFGIACADVRLEAEMRVAADIVRHADAAGEIRAEEVAVIDTQDGEEHRVL